MISADFGHAPAGCETLTATLHDERDVLDRLLWVLTSEQLMLDNHGTRWLAQTNARVAGLVDRLRELDLVRSVALSEVLAEYGLLPGTTLLALADVLGEPIGSIHRELHRDIRALVDEIDGVVRRNEELLLDAIRPDRGGSIEAAR